MQDGQVEQELRQQGDGRREEAAVGRGAQAARQRLLPRRGEQSRGGLLL